MQILKVASLRHLATFKEIPKVLSKASSAFAIFLIRIYQYGFSIHMGGACRFQPTCSHYGIEAFKTHPPIYALKLTIKRILKCRPGGAFGFDPISKTTSSKGKI